MAGVKGKSGGARPNSGAKPSAYTQLKRRLQAEKIEDAEYAFSLYAQVMKDEAQAMPMRLSAATWIAERVLGKAQDKTNLSGDVLIRVIRETINDQRDSDSSADSASGTSAD